MLGLIAFALLAFLGEDDALTICAIIGGILAIPGGILGATVDSLFNFSIIGLLNSSIADFLDTWFGRVLTWAYRAFMLPFVIACIGFIFFG